jgi:hypothetical protein
MWKLLTGTFRILAREMWQSDAVLLSFEKHNETLLNMKGLKRGKQFE